MTEKTKYKKSLFIFRRDYRLQDNTALISALKKSETVIPIFIFTFKQIRDNPLKSNNCVQFLVEALEDLQKQLEDVKSRLFIYYGDEMEILEALLKKNPEIKAIFFNMDYTAYSQKRDAAIIKLAKEYECDVNIEEDIMLHNLGEVKTTTGGIYTKYTPYYRKSLSIPVRSIENNNYKNYVSISSKLNGVEEYPLKNCHKFYGNKANSNLPHKGGRMEGLKIIAKIANWKNYDNMRNELDYETTRLSAFNKFGCISVREAFHNIKEKCGLKSGIIGQYIWRDFFYTLSYHHPEIYEYSLNPKYRNIKWENNQKALKAWQEGRTGFPIVDAAMMEMNITGYMHNRGRLIVSNFLIRMLHINWQEGEHYFAKTLYDYDPAQNNFGWEISAFTSGTESRPVNQTIMNPWIQSKSFDKDASYIKKWLPILKDIPPNHLHSWNKYADTYIKEGLKYPAPIIDYEKEKQNSLKQYGYH